MIRQAHTYLVGAMGGATLIAIAIAVFVVLVSFQVFRDWPIAAFGGEDKAAVSAGQPVGGDGAAAATTAAGASPTDAAAANRDRTQSAAGGRSAAPAAGGAVAGNPGTGFGSTDPGSSETAAGGGGSQGGGDATGTAPQTTNAASPGGSGGGTVQTSSGGGSTGGGGGKTSSGGGGSEGSGSIPSTSGQVTETVNNTVNQVDESVLGGTLDKTGVTQVTEGVVNGVAGPESTVGKVVDEAVGVVGGLLGGGKR